MGLYTLDYADKNVGADIKVIISGHQLCGT